MEGQTVFERSHVVVSLLPGVVGRMYAYSQIAAQYEHADVVAQSNTCTEGYVVEKSFVVEFASGAVGVTFQQPNITGIDKGGTVQVAPDGEAILDVRFEFECTRLVEVPVDIVFGREITSGAE